MKVVVPINFTDSTTNVSSVTETLPQWVTSKSPPYAVGDKVYFDGAYGSNIHRVYQRLVAGAGTTAPNLDTANWLDIGPNNKWAAMDTSNSTASVMSGIVAWFFLALAPSAPLFITVGLFGMVGRHIVVQAQTSGGSVYGTTVDIYAPDVSLDPLKPSQHIIQDIQIPAGGKLAVSIQDIVSGVWTDVKCGTIVVGPAVSLGDTQYNPTLGINSFSTKNTDAFGITTFVKRANSKRVTAKVQLNNANLNTVAATLFQLEAVPCVWIPTDSSTFNALNVFGFFKDFSIDVAYLNESLCSIEIESLA